jgi:hypothetical protein
VTREQFRLALGNFSKLALKSVSNTGVKGTSWFAQEGAIGSILDQGMLEKVCCVRSDTLSEKQSRRNEPVERRIDFRFGLAHHGRK